MPLVLVKRRTIWWPTWLGWTCLLIGCGSMVALWLLLGEPFLSLNEPVQPDVLVVEGWIGPAGVKAAHAEFVRGHYRYVVATSGLTGMKWDLQRWSYAGEALKLLRQSGVTPDQAILATPKETGVQRTFESAVATREALRAHNIAAKDITVFTQGAHARRSRLTFAKILGKEFNVGVIAWAPPGYEMQKWWESSDRAQELFKESAAYGFELLLNSGRRSNVDSQSSKN